MNKSAGVTSVEPGPSWARWPAIWLSAPRHGGAGGGGHGVVQSVVVGGVSGHQPQPPTGGDGLVDSVLEVVAAVEIGDAPTRCRLRSRGGDG